jgi:hypothetical protein
VPNPKVFCLEINSHCQTKVAAKKECTTKPGMILKTISKKAESQTVLRKLQLKNKSSTTCGMK